MMEKYEEGYYEMGLNAYDGDEPYIFVSYSHEDIPQVRDIMKRIDKEKFRYWYDDVMEVGEDFRIELQTKIENCSAFLLFVSCFGFEIYAMFFEYPNVGLFLLHINTICGIVKSRKSCQ